MIIPRKLKKTKKNLKSLISDVEWGNDLTALFEISKNIELYGIEIDDEKIAACQPKNIMIFKINCETDRIPVNDNFFDIIIINQVLEHTKEIFYICSEISRVLNKQGILIIGVPNLASFHNRILLFFGYQPTCIELIGPHVRGFTAPALKNFISRGNFFTVKEIKGSNFFRPLKYQNSFKIFPTIISFNFFISRTVHQKKDYLSKYLRKKILRQIII